MLYDFNTPRSNKNYFIDNLDSYILVIFHHKSYLINIHCKNDYQPLERIYDTKTWY